MYYVIDLTNRKTQDLINELASSNIDRIERESLHFQLLDPNSDEAKVSLRSLETHLDFRHFLEFILQRQPLTIEQYDKASYYSEWYDGIRDLLDAFQCVEQRRSKLELIEKTKKYRALKQWENQRNNHVPLKSLCGMHSRGVSNHPTKKPSF